MQYVVTAMFMILTCFHMGAAQAASPVERESLRGLPGVGLVIERISPDAKANGLTEEAVQTSVELILRSSGIRILSASERWEELAAPFLLVQINTVKGNWSYAANVTVTFNQKVALISRPQYVVFAPSWINSVVVIAGFSKLRELVSIAIEPQIKEFANDFLAVNPR